MASRNEIYVMRHVYLRSGGAAFATTSSTTQPEAIFFNGKIVTMDSGGSTVNGVAVKDGKILKAGNSDDIKKLAGPSTSMLDLQGKTVVPGLIDAHCHPMETIFLKEGWVDCRYPKTKSVRETLYHIAE